jgi:3-hydroxybenzoate 6-monooxygenase
MERTQILIVGGGIGGLALALGLARRGRKVHVIERAPEFVEIGAGIQLAPNASWALDQLGVLQEIHSYAVFPQRLVWMDSTSGEQLTSMDLGQPFLARYGYPYFVMHRSDLLDVLLKACQAEPNVTLEANREANTVEDRAATTVVTCSNGSSYEADIVIGADGLRSGVRKAIFNDGDPICSAYVAYRGTIPIDEVSASAGFDNVIVWTGPDRHLVQYPVRRGELYNQVAVFKSRRYLAGGAGDDWGLPDELDEMFASGTDLVRSGIAQMGRQRRWPMFDRLPGTNWTRNRVTLLGDAAHPMLQYLAQGAAQALEDTAVLGAMLADLAAGADPAPVFRAYEAERAPRTARVQTQARVWGDYWHLHPGPLKVSRDAMLQARSATDYSESDWYYGYRGKTATATVSP